MAYVFWENQRHRGIFQPCWAVLFSGWLSSSIWGPTPYLGLLRSEAALPSQFQKLGPPKAIQIPMVAHDFLIILSCSIYFPTNFLPEVKN
jgi:hypothetical protein